MKKIRYNLDLPAGDYRKLKAKCKRDGEPVSVVIRSLIREFIGAGK
jgi:hypothetical protein